MPETTPLRPTGGRLWIASFVGVAVGCILTLIIDDFLGRVAQYGTPVFCVVPTFVGFTAALFIGKQTPISYRQAVKVSLMCTAIAAAALLAFAWEGLICIVMALPIVIPFCMVGSVLGAALTNWAYRKYVARAIGVTAPILPALAIALTLQSTTGEVRTETTTMVIHAPPSKIWPLIFNLSDLPGQKWFLFDLGIACPNGTRTSDIRAGGSRFCELSTGDMPEKIAKLEPNAYMKFDILKTPPTMRELNPFYAIHPPHLEGYFNCHWGDFRLQQLPNGDTLLTGSSTYDFKIYPAPYWGLWTDTIVEQVHQRMMGEIKRQAETAP